PRCNGNFYGHYISVRKFALVIKTVHQSGKDGGEFLTDEFAFSFGMYIGYFSVFAYVKFNQIISDAFCHTILSIVKLCSNQLSEVCKAIVLINLNLLNQVFLLCIEVGKSHKQHNCEGSKGFYG